MSHTSKGTADSPAQKVEEAVNKTLRAGFSTEQFFIAARRHTGAPFDPCQVGRLYRRRPMTYQPLQAVMTFSDWVNATETRRLQERLAKLLGLTSRAPALSALAAT
jgi:hypothetical protein